MNIPKLTDEGLKAMVREETYTRPGNGTLTICVLTLTNGCTVTGQDNVMDPANFRPDTGREMAKRDAISNLYPLEGYARKRALAHNIVLAAKAGHAAQRVMQAALGSVTFLPWDELDQAQRADVLYMAEAVWKTGGLPMDEGTDESKEQKLIRVAFEQVVSAFVAPLATQPDPQP